MIRILVCFKQVAHLYSLMGMDSRGKIDPDGLVYLPNPYDEVALEEALRIKERLSQAEVILVSLGGPQIEKTLRYGLSMGADKAIYVCDERLENIETWVRSKVLAKLIETMEFDLILCGKKAIDDNEGVIGGFLGELLNLPYISSVSEIALTPDGKRAKMYKILERGDRQLMECELPALFSVERGLTKPRYPTLMGRLIASKKEILKFDPTEFGIDSLIKFEKETKVQKISISRPRPKKIFTPDSNLPAEERIKLIMSGGIKEKKSDLLKGSPKELAEQFISFLEENRIIRKRQRMIDR